MIPVAEALDRILGDVEPLPAEQVPLLDGFGRVIAADVTARRTQPPMAVSAMDGYAVRSADAGTVPVTLRQIGTVPAGSIFAGRVGAGEALRTSSEERRVGKESVSTCRTRWSQKS